MGRKKRRRSKTHGPQQDECRFRRTEQVAGEAGKSSGFLKKPETQQQQKGEMLARESATREDVLSTEKRPWFHRKETSGMM